MSCLCDKLRTRQYSNITPDEAQILKRTWKEAADLFQAVPPTPSISTRPSLSPPISTRPSLSPPISTRPSSSPPISTRPSSSPPLTIEHPTAQPQSTRKRSLPNTEPPTQKRSQVPSIRRSLIYDRDEASEAAPDFASPSTSASLEITYSDQNAAKVLEKGVQLDIQHQGSVYVRIFLAIEQADKFRRICYYAFAQLHKKGTPVDAVVKEIQDVLGLPAEDTRKKVHHFLHLGNRWAELIGLFASIVKGVPEQLTGLPCLLGSVSVWERATTEDCRLALTNLHLRTAIYSRTLEVSHSVNKTLKQILGQRCETSILIQPSQLLGMEPLFKIQPMPLAPASSSPRRDLHTVPTEPAWKASFLAAVSEASLLISSIGSDDGSILLVLLSFLSPSGEIPHDLLLRGAMPRKRWSESGEIEEVGAVRVGLVPELSSLLSDTQRLYNALYNLILSSTVSANSDQTFTVNKATRDLLHCNISPEHFSFWRCQALIVAYRAIPWKYVEPVIPKPKLFLLHLRHALQAFQDDFDPLPGSITRTDLALTLVEASRFPNMAWKRFAVSQAEAAARGLDDPYLSSCIKQSQCLVSRIGGGMEQAVSNLEPLGAPNEGRLPISTDKRMHSAFGLTAIQHSLNCLQVEDLSGAKKHLNDWNPLSNPSPMEEVVLFRKDMILGRALRFQGEFEEALAHLKRSQKRTGQHNDTGLIFDEDLRDLTCDLADTLRELDDPVSAEDHLRTEIERRGLSPSQSGCLLELSLAEALFAQKRFEDAEQVCLKLQSRSGLLKMEKLRLHITMAKIRQVNSDHEGALSCWSGAMGAVGKFTMTNGRTTRIIVMSICDNLGCLGQTWLRDASLKQVDYLDEIAKPGGVQYWIAGLRHWVEHLQSKGPFFRSRM